MRKVLYLRSKEYAYMARINYINPFFTTIDIPDEYFCDRDEDTARIIDNIRNGSNVVLKAPRRVGKSSLIKHIFEQKTIKNEYNTLYVDIYGTKNSQEFQAVFQARLINAPFAKATKVKKELESLLKGVYLNLGGVNTVSGRIDLPTIGFNPATSPVLSLQSIFDFLAHTKKPNLVVFDEFQQIEEYPERMAAILRSFVQESGNTRFIFSGSSRHMLTTMFHLSNQPFYKSAVSMDLDIIPIETYVDFCSKMFAIGRKTIEPEAVRFAYMLLSGETFLMQSLMKEIYSSTPGGASVTFDTVKESLMRLLESKETDYRDIVNRLNSKKERNTLFCIACEGIGKELTSARIIRKYDLEGTSAVQNALNNLGEGRLNLVTRLCKGTYVLQDRLFELWLASKFGQLQQKFDTVAERFIEQREIEKAILDIPSPK